MTKPGSIENSGRVALNRRSSNKKRSVVLAFSLCLTFQPILLAAPLPTNPNVQHGDVNINTSGNQMDVNQNSQYGIVDWESFSIDSGYGVNFNNGSGSTLNRVTGVEVSNIYGNLSATGNLYLLNSNGVIIGEGGRVLTGGDFVASTMDITNEDFLNGGGLSLFGQSTAGITNLGVISSSGGNVLLAGYKVSNEGSISASEGSAGLVAGTQIDVLTDLSWANGRYAVSLGERDNTVTNEGRIEAMVAELRTHNGNIYALAGNNEGLIHATGVNNQGGKVFLTTEEGLVQSSGQVIAERGDSVGDFSGGDINIEAIVVQNYGGVQDVSGATGGSIAVEAGTFISDTLMLAEGTDGDGGVITVDGDGEVLITSGANINADGSENGGEVAINAGSGHLILSGNIYTRGQMQGGRTSLWGNDIAMLGGSIRADGGPLGGEIYIGGGYQGQSIWSERDIWDTAWPLLSDVENSQSTYISENSLLTADAGFLGKGGTVVAWSDGTTQFAGEIYARGGIEGGNGGLVETSGLQGLGVSGSVDASARAAYGNDGNWLLDPKNIVIDTITDSFSEFTRITETDEGFGFPTDRTPDAGQGAGFGRSVDVYGNTLVVGTGGGFNNSFDFPSANNDGAAYVFVDGAIAARLTSSEAGAIDFARLVAVTGTGAEADLIGAVDFSDNRLHIFQRGAGWNNGSANQIALHTNPQSASNFGETLAADRGTFYVGAPAYDGNTKFNIGAVFAYNQFGQSGSFIFEAESDSSSFFGSHLAASEGWLHIGWRAGATSSRQIFSRDTNTGAQVIATQSNVISDFSFNGFAADGGLLAAINGTNNINSYLFDSSGGAVSLVGTGSLFVGSASIADFDVSDDGVLIVGQNGFFNPTTLVNGPRVGFYNLGSSQFLHEIFLDNSVGGIQSVAIDGQYAAIGIPQGNPTPADAGDNIGVAHLFESTSATNWGSGVTTTVVAPAARDTGFAFGIDVAVDGNTIAISDNNAGSELFGAFQGLVYVYENNTLAAVLESDQGRLGDRFGESFGSYLDLDNNTLVVADLDDDGAHLHVFERGSGWANGTGNRTGLRSTFSSSEIFDQVAIDGDVIALGRRVISGGNAGQVNISIFENTGSGWQNALNAPVNTLEARPVGSANFMGRGLALDGNTLVASYPTTSPTSTVLVYENTANDWSQAPVLTTLQGGAGDTGFGAYIDVSGDTIAVGFDTCSACDHVVDVFERTTDWASASTAVARLTSGGSLFGAGVAIDGDILAVQDFQFAGRVLFFDRQSGWQNGDTNLVSTFTSTDSLRAGTIALSGNIAAVGVLAGSGFNRQAYVLDGPFDLTGRNTFALTIGDTVNISATSISNSLSLGTDVTLQANNDITVQEAIVVNNTSGDGGNLTLQAGRSILVNDSITTDNGDITLIADDPGADQSQRDAGEGVVVLGRDATNAPANLIVGTGTVLINGGDRFENRAGDSTPFVFDAVTPGNWLIYSSSPDPRDAPSPSGITIDARTHAPPASGTPDATDRDFVVYNQDFDVNDPRPASLPAGNGFVYSGQPSVQVDVGNDSITFGQTPTANLTLSGLSISGTDVTDYMIGAGDTVTPGELFMVSSADLPNLVDTGLAGSVTTSTGGFANAGTYVGGLTATARATVTTGGVFGVDVSTGAAGDLTVAQATLNVRPDNISRQYGTVDPAFTFTYTGLVTGDTAADINTAPTVTSDAMIDSDVGGYTLTATGGSDNNYILNITGTALLTVDPFDLTITGLTGTNRVYDTTTDAQFTGTATIGALPIAGDDVTLTGTLTATASFANANVDTGKDLVFAGYGLSGADVGNYNLIFPVGVTADITAMELQVVGLTADDRVYDATTLAALQGTAFVTGLAGDDVSLSGAAVGNFADENVGDGKTVNLSGLALTGTEAGNYVLAADSGITANVTALDLNVTGLTADNRVYDATDVATLTGTGTVLAIAGDTVSLDGAAVGTFDDKNVGTGKSVTVSGLSLSGLDAGNYNLVFPSALTADITQADIQVTGLTAESRIYDRTAVANLTGVATVTALGADTLTVEGTAAGTFGDKNVGTGKAVTVTGLTLGGTEAANYNILQPTGLTADITARPITITGLTVDDKVYDATTDTTLNGTAAFSGILAGDTATIDGSAASYAFEDENAGADKNIDISGVLITGTDAANYDATSADGLVADITPAALTISGVNAADRVYDSTTNVALSGGSVQGVIAGDDITLDTSSAVGTLDDKNIGVNKDVTASGYAVTGTDAGNYNLEQPTGLMATITAAVLNIVGLNGDKAYDGLASVVLSFTGLDSILGSDDVALDDSAVTAAYDDKNAGTGRDITITGNFGLNGTDAGNYSLTQPVNLTGDIAQRGITVEGLIIADKEYDGTRVGTIEGTGTFGGTIAGDDLQIDVGVVNVEFADKNVGDDKAVTLSGVTLTGADAANYTAATPTGITASITPLDINVDGIAADDKVYDRTADATLTGTGNLVGAIAGDVLVLDESSRTGTFDDKNVGDDKAVAVNGLTLTGTDAGNYNLIAPQNVTASVTPADVILGGLTAEDRIYDATVDVALTGSATLDFGVLTGVLEASEDVSFGGTAMGELADKNVADDKAVTVVDATLAGADAGNYNLVLPTTLTASIAIADVSIENLSVASRVYDGTTNAEISGAGTVLALGADDLSLGGTAVAQFDDKNVGTGKNVDVTGYTLAGADAANYNLLPVTGFTADITAAELVLDGLVADSREYDGTNIAPLSGSLNVNSFAGDNVSVAGQISANFDDKNVGENRAVTVTGLSLSGSDAGNYSLTIPELMADITARNLTVLGIVAEDRVYDGTTDALLGGDVSLSGTITGDNVGFDASTLEGSFGDKNVGDDKLITLSGEGGLTGSDAGNYVLRDLPFGLTANVTPLAIDVAGVEAQDREYDGTFDAQLAGGELTGVIEGDSVSLVTDNASGQFVDRNAGEDIQVNADGYAIVGDDALNYTVNQPQNLLASISARILEVLGISVADKFFDGNTDAVIAGGSLSGIITGDDVSLTGAGSGQFLDPEIGDGKPVTLSGFVLEGADAANYVISSDPQATGNILRELEIITDIIPAEVLRASSEEAIQEEREALTQFANAQEDTLVVIDYEQFNDELSSGIVVNKPIQALLDTPLEQQDLVTKNYIAVATEAASATEYAQNMAWEYRRFARIYKESGQELNQNVRDLQVENGLRDNFVQQIELATTELAKLDDNLAQIQQAKTRISRYRQRIQEAARLGLGAEVAEYEQVIRDAEAVVATEAQVQAERARMAEALEENQADLEESETKIAELTERQVELEETIEESETAVANLRRETERAKEEAAELAEKMAEAKEAGQKAYAERAENLAEAKAAAESELSELTTLWESSVADETAAAMVDQDVTVKLYAEKLAEAQQVTQTVGNKLSETLSPASLSYAQKLADNVNSGGTLDDPKVMRNALVQSVPALAELQAEYDTKLAAQQQKLAAMQERIRSAGNNAKNGLGYITADDKEAYVANAEKNYSEVLNNRLGELTNGALDLSSVPKTDASGRVIPEIERMSIAILNTQLNPPKIQAPSQQQIDTTRNLVNGGMLPQQALDNLLLQQERAEQQEAFASGMQQRMSGLVAQELGFSPEQALNDPNLVVEEAKERLPFNSDGSFDKEQLATNLKDGAAAYVRLKGSLKDQALKQAAEQDPTGTLKIYTNAEEAARAEFVKEYGAQPEELFIQKAQERIDEYKNADSPEALMELYARDNLGGQGNIDAAKAAFEGLKAGDNPVDVLKSMANAKSNAEGGGSANQEAARAARTADAMEAAAITAAEDADKTGLFKANNAIKGAAEKEFAAVFGATPREMGIEALENPSAALEKVKDTASDIFTTPDGAVNAASLGISTASNMADATIAAAQQQIDNFASKLGGPGKAAAFVAKHGITAATEAKDFLQDLGSTMTGGLIKKSGPSKSEVEAAVAYQKAQNELSVAKAIKERDDFLLEYIQLAQDMAKLKYELAVGVNNAKQQVGQYVMAAKQENDRQEYHTTVRETTQSALSQLVKNEIQDKVTYAQTKVNELGQSPEEIAAKAAVWGS